MSTIWICLIVAVAVGGLFHANARANASHSGGMFDFSPLVWLFWIFAAAFVIVAILAIWGWTR